MRYILALMIALPLLLAGSAWAVTYDGEARGNDIPKCDDGAIDVDIQFIVDGSAVEGTFNKGTLTGSIKGDRAKARAVNSFPRAGSENWRTGIRATASAGLTQELVVVERKATGFIM